jgi:hypothetical protein
MKFGMLRMNEKDFTIQIRDRHVGRAHHSLASRSGRPMQHRSTGEMPAAADQRDTLLQLESFALPELDAAIRLPHPFGVVGVKMHRHIPERSAPINKRCVEVRMRDRDGAQSAKSVDQGDRSVVDQGDAIPEDVPFRRTQKHCALPDGEFRSRADADETWLVLAKSVVVRNPQPLQRCPRLALGRNELTLVLAHRAMGRWSFAWRILRATGRADESRHGFTPLATRTHPDQPNTSWLTCHEGTGDRLKKKIHNRCISISLSYEAGSTIARIRGVCPQGRATADEDGHYSFAVAL